MEKFKQIVLDCMAGTIIRSIERDYLRGKMRSNEEYIKESMSNLKVTYQFRTHKPLDLNVMECVWDEIQQDVVEIVEKHLTRARLRMTPKI